MSSLTLSVVMAGLASPDPGENYRALEALYPLLESTRDPLGHEVARVLFQDTVNPSTNAGLLHRLREKEEALRLPLEKLREENAREMKARALRHATLKATGVEASISGRLLGPLARGVVRLPAEGCVLDQYRAVSLDDPEARSVLEDLFQRNLALDILLAAFTPEVRGYRLSQLVLTPLNIIGGVLLYGTLETEQGAPAGEFSRIIPEAHSGVSWEVSGLGFNDEHPERFAHHNGRGIGRSLLQGFLSLSYYLGADAMALTAGLSGRYVWPRMGFDFYNHTLTRSTRDRLLEFLQAHGMPLSEDRCQRVNSLRTAWDLSDFNVDGRAVGKEFFLSDVSRINMSFPLDPAYEVWEKLFTNKPGK